MSSRTATANGSVYGPNPPRPNPAGPRRLRGRDGRVEADHGPCASLYRLSCSALEPAKPERLLPAKAQAQAKPQYDKCKGSGLGDPGGGFACGEGSDPNAGW